MQLETFLNHNNLHLKRNEIELCEVAIKMMRASVDPNHDHEHVFELLSDLNYFLNESDEIVKSHLDLKSLVIAICWHDTWKSTRPQTVNFLKFLFEQFWDGMGSYYKFKGYVASLDEEQRPPQHEVDMIAYLIRRHARFDNFWPKFIVKAIFDPQVPEARILRDIDHLETWNIKRMKHLEDFYLKNGKPRGVLRSQAAIAIARFYFRFQHKSDSRWKFYYKWSVGVYEKRRVILMAEFHKLWKNLHTFFGLPYKIIDQ